MDIIEGVRIKQLKVIPDERGRLMETLRDDDDLFVKFGQAYVTTAYPGVVKAWHYHKKQIEGIFSKYANAPLELPADYDVVKDAIFSRIAG